MMSVMERTIVMGTIRSMLKNLLHGMASQGVAVDADWINDPLRHPELARMDLRELGDLPMPGFARPAHGVKTFPPTVLPLQPQGRTTTAGQGLRTAC